MSLRSAVGVKGVDEADEEVCHVASTEDVCKLSCVCLNMHTRLARGEGDLIRKYLPRRAHVLYCAHSLIVGQLLTSQTKMSSLTERAYDLLPCPLVEKEAPRGLEDVVALKGGEALELGGECERVPGAKRRASDRVGWVEFQQARDGSVRCVGEEGTLDEGCRILLSPEYE